MDVEVYANKLQRLFDKIVKSNFEFKNDIYLGYLIHHLSEEVNSELSSTLLNLPVIKEWLVNAVLFWEHNYFLTCSGLGNFILELLSLVSRNETSFNFMLHMNVYEKVTRIVASDIEGNTKLSQMKLFNSLLLHRSGLDWLVEKNVCDDVLSLSLTNQDNHVFAKECKNFVVNYLMNTVNVHERLCYGTLQKITDALETHLVSFELKNSNNINEEEFYMKTSPVISMIFLVLEQIYRESLNDSALAFKLFSVVQKMNLYLYLEKYFTIANNDNLLSDICNILIIAEFIKLLTLKETEDFLEHKKTFVTRITGILQRGISKNKIVVVFRYCFYLLGYWVQSNPKLARYVPKKLENEVVLEFQVIFMQLLPLFIIAEKVCRKLIKDGCNFNDDRIRDIFTEKLFELISPKTVRLTYQWRSCILEQNNKFEIAREAISFILQSKPLYSQQMGVLIFQSFVYCIKDILLIIKMNYEVAAVFRRNEEYLKHLLNATTEFIQDFNITWRDSIESINILQLAFEFLSIPQWSSKIVVMGLKLLKISVVKHMSANMALLVDQFSDSSSALMGPLLYAKFHDVDWQVRGTALEVVTVLAQVSNNFPSLQQILISSELISLTFKMGLEDEECFVRATALRCLAQLVIVNEFWNVLKDQFIPQKMMKILTTDAEGIVRAEAALVLTYIQKNNPKSMECIPSFRQSMFTASLNDPHWEVRLTVLDYWADMIDKLLLKQGMIDGVFPEFTFSGQHRKIVALTESEVARRLRIVLDELSRSGCLSIMYNSISQDCDINVSRKALNITQKLIVLLKKYGLIFSEAANSIRSCSILKTSPMDFCAESPTTANFTINQIYPNLPTPPLEGFGGDKFPPPLPTIEPGLKYHLTSPEFLDFVRIDLEKFIVDREHLMGAVGTLDSLLDDLLEECGENVSLLMDCH